METALFPGTFDPPTLGHLDLIERASTLFDMLYVGIGENISKSQKPLFNLREKREMLIEITASFPRVKIIDFSGLAVEYAKKNKIGCLIRGLRTSSDFEYEFRMALANRKIAGIETLFLMADERYAHMSSTLIRELGFYHAPLSHLVPASIGEKVSQKFHA